MIRKLTVVKIHEYSTTVLIPNFIFCRSWKKLGVSLKLSSENLETQTGCTNLFKESTKLGAIQGIFFVQDSKTEQGTADPQEFVQKFNKTALVVANLDLISRNLCPELRYVNCS